MEFITICMDCALKKSDVTELIYIDFMQARVMKCHAWQGMEVPRISENKRALGNVFQSLFIENTVHLAP
jgi:hypothetical protein